MASGLSLGKSEYRTNGVPKGCAVCGWSDNIGGSAGSKSGLRKFIWNFTAICDMIGAWKNGDAVFNC